MGCRRKDQAEKLRNEIKDLKETLLKFDSGNMQFVAVLMKINNRIVAMLDEQLDVENFSYRTPIHDILSVRLTTANVPLHIIELLLSAGFPTNNKDYFMRTCLDIAVENHHYNTIKLLLKHGALSSTESVPHHLWIVQKSPIVLLASQPNVPLDLFDMLATPRNLNDNCRYKYLPLHEAASCGHTKSALHLIKLGAKVFQQDGVNILPLEYYWRDNEYHLNNELFLSLLPSKSHGEDILRLICKMLIGENFCIKKATEVNRALPKLLQRLHFDEPLNVDMHHKGYFGVNGKRISTRMDGKSIPNARYLCSVILTELRFNFVSTPRKIVDTLVRSATKKQLACVRATDEIWKFYHQQSRVKPLQRLCILQIRSCMRNLDDESFLGLAETVPPYIHKLLTYRDVSEKIFGKWRRGPPFC